LVEAIASPVDDAENDLNCWEASAYRDHGFEIIEKIGEGGEGEIYKAVQTTVDRTVALKVLKHGMQREFGGAEHFLEGARIGARLEHPGILPVYEVGKIADRPFFTMRLINRGGRFADLLAAHPKTPFNRLLAVYKQVCETMAYAHERGIVHLDLNPRNVMIGDHGEVLVIDWGLARQRGAWEGLEPWSRGTPSYAAPEQITGAGDPLDSRCDVFALGAMLCEILTGRPPYFMTSPEPRRRQIERELAKARTSLQASKADGELSQLATDCLEFDRAQRPRSAVLIAHRIEAYQLGEQKRHELSKKARWKAEERVKWIVAAALAAVMLILLCAAAASIYQTRQLRVESEARQKLDSLLSQGELDFSRGRIADAQAAAQEAEGRLEFAGKSLRQTYDRRIAELAMLARLWRIRNPSSPDEWAAHRRRPQVARHYEHAFRTFGVEVDNFHDAVGRIKRSNIQLQLIVALDDWTETASDRQKRETLWTIADAADPLPAGPLVEIRHAKHDRDIKQLKQLAARSDVRALPAPVLASLSVWLRKEGALGDAVALLRNAWNRHPSDFWINLELGTNLALVAVTQPTRSEADAYLTASLALSRRSPLVFTYLGVIAHDFGLAEGDPRYFERSEAAYRSAIGIDPNYAPAYCNRANSLTALGRFDEALAELRTAIKLEPSYALAYFNLGCAQAAAARFAEAASAYRQAIRHDPDYAEAYINLGGAEYNLGEFTKAVQDYTRGLDRLAASEPSRDLFAKQRDLAGALAAVKRKLAAVRAGAPAPTRPAEALDLARLCVHRAFADDLLAARLFHQAFAARPELQDDPIMGDRYAAAAAAARAAVAPSLPDFERARLRGWSLDWLRAELALRRPEISGVDSRVKRDSLLKLNFWCTDPSFAPLRRHESLERLPEPERHAWQALWAQVGELRNATARQ
jgi:serine/threonine-protein kinase